MNHNILLEKLEPYGIRGIALKWFENYLKRRKQRVKVGSMFSEWQNVNIGLPQGSVLWSLLFLVYINNLPTVSSILHSVLYANNTCLTSADDNYSNLFKTFNSELKRLYAWLIKNRLSLNFEKKNIYIKFSLRGYESDETLQLNGISFSEVDRTKYVGFFWINNYLFLII